MNFIFVAFIIVVSSLSTVFSSQYTETQKFYDFLEANGKEIDSEEAETPHLRTEAWGFQFLEIWSYQSPDCNLLHAIEDVWLNGCIPAKGKKDTHWAWYSVQKSKTDLWLTVKFFNDVQCSVKSLKTVKVNLGPADTCNGQGFSFHAAKKVPQHLYPSLPGVALSAYPSQSECWGNDLQNINEIWFQPIGICIPHVNGPDYSWNSCDGNSASKTVFESTGGSCVGNPQTQWVYQSAMCTSGPNWTTFKCM